MLYKILHESAVGTRMSPPSVGFFQCSVLWDGTFLSESVMVDGDNDCQTFITESFTE